MSPALALLVALVADAGERRALLVGMSDYSYDDRGNKPGDQWNDLDGAADAEAMYAMLAARGFAPEHMSLVVDKDATAERFRTELTALAADSGPGDHVLVYYSGHGHQTADDNQDESDGLDELLVLYGAPARPPKGYDGRAHLRDDELDVAIRALRGAVAPDGSVAVVLDSCHSGTATRGESAPGDRGGQPALAPSSGPPDPDVGFVDPVPSVGLAPFVALSASSSTQTAQQIERSDGSTVGVLTWALLESLGNPEIETWRQLWEGSRALISSLGRPQQPQLEGDRDLALFDQGVRPAEPSFFAERMPGEGRARFRIQGGALHGLVAGSAVELHPAWAVYRQTGQRPATGTLVEVGPTRSVVELAAKSAEIPSPARAFVAHARPERGQRTLALIGFAPDEERAWRQALKKSAKIVGGPADLQLQRIDGEVQLQTGDGATVLGTSEPDILDRLGPEEAGVLRALSVLSQLESLMDDRPTATAFALAAEVLDAIQTDAGCVPGEPRQTPLAPGDAFALQVTHLGTLPATLEVLYQGPVGAPMVLPMPPDRLEPGKTVTLGGCWVVPDDELDGSHRLRVVALRDMAGLGDALSLPQRDSELRGGGEVDPGSTHAHAVDVVYEVAR